MKTFLLLPAVGIKPTNSCFSALRSTTPDCSATELVLSVQKPIKASFYRRLQEGLLRMLKWRETYSKQWCSWHDGSTYHTDGHGRPLLLPCRHLPSHGNHHLSCCPSCLLRYPPSNSDHGLQFAAKFKKKNNWSLCTQNQYSKQKTTMSRHNDKKWLTKLLTALSKSRACFSESRSSNST